MHTEQFRVNVRHSPKAGPTAAQAATNVIETGRPRRKRMTVEVNLSNCFCGHEVSQAQQRISAAVKCRKRDCETVWYHYNCFSDTEGQIFKVRRPLVPEIPFRKKTGALYPQTTACFAKANRPSHRAAARQDYQVDSDSESSSSSTDSEGSEHSDDEQEPPEAFECLECLYEHVIPPYISPLPKHLLETNEPLRECDEASLRRISAKAKFPSHLSSLDDDILRAEYILKRMKTRRTDIAASALAAGGIVSSIR
ncbi:hypothetical protein C8J56DRAFT_1115360 [Mycena floridula]|nr:hypothetical protein C8J56DRAFT_1115360 [Mycena floridula]